MLKKLLCRIFGHPATAEKWNPWEGHNWHRQWKKCPRCGAYKERGCNADRSNNNW